MLIEIKNRFDGKIILSGEYESIKDALIKNYGANLSRADLSGANLSRADLSEANLSEADLSEANLSRADLSRAYLYGADLSEANLSEADLSEANLSEANLSEADLSEADLSEANLSRANLSEANLYGADLSGVYGILNILSIYGSKHPVCYYIGKIKIGCEYHTVQEWIDNFESESFGKNNQYTPEQIKEYKGHIMVCKQFHDNIEVGK